MCHLCLAAKRGGILCDQGLYLAEQVGKRLERAFAEVEQRALYAVPLRTPAVLVHEEYGVHAPVLVGSAQPVEHAADTEK